MVSEKKKVIDLKLSRNQMDIVLSIKAVTEIEEFFRKASLEGENRPDDSDAEVTSGISRSSGKWLDADGNGLRYYVKNARLSRRVGDQAVIDNFGNGLTDGDRINVAFLRCVGISDGITIKTTDLLSFEEMRDFMERLANWARDFYEANLVTSEVTASITVEIESKNDHTVSA